MAYKTSGGVLDPKSLSDEQLKSWAAENSSAWHTDPENRSRYEAENKAINALLDERNGTKSTLDTTTGKWNVTGAGSPGTLSPGSGGSSGGTSKMSSQDILNLGKGPLSQAGVNKVLSEGGSGYTMSSPPWSATQQAPVVQGYTQADLDDAVKKAVEEQKRQSEYALTEYIKQQKAAELESQLAGLQGAYEESLTGLRSAQDRLPGAYEDARNSAAAQNALERRRFLEGAAYQGLGSGAAGQAELTRGAALTGTLAQIDRAQADSQADLNLEKATLESRYQQAIQQARANGDSELAATLYQELVRLQGIEREDKQLAQVQEQLLYNRQKAEDALVYEKEQAERAEAQERINTYLSALGKSGDLDQDLIAKSGYTLEELNALEQFYAQQMGLGKEYTGSLYGDYGVSGSGSYVGSYDGGELAYVPDEELTPVPASSPVPSSPTGGLDGKNRDSYSAPALDWENRDEYGVVPDTVTRDLRPYARNLLRQLQGGISRTNWTLLIENAFRRGDIDDYEANYIMDQLGYN